MKSLLLSLFIAGSFNSCKHDDTQKAIVDLNIVLTIETEDGLDLLNPALKNSIKKEDIVVLYEIDGRRETYQTVFGTPGDAVLDNSSGFSLNPPDGSQIFGNNFFIDVISNSNVGKSTTIIQIKGRQEIRLETNVEKTKESLRVSKIWYNSDLVWPVEGNNEPKFVQVIMK